MLVVILTSVGSNTSLGTSGLLGYRSSIVVTKSVNVIVRVGVTASTGIGCITCILASGRSYNRVVRVTCCSNCLCTSMATVILTGVSLDTRSGTSGILGYCALVPAVTRCGNRLCVGVSAAIVLTGVCLNASLGTGGSGCNFACIAVTKSRDKSFTAYSTGLCRSTGCCCAGSMAISFNLNGLAAELFVTSGTVNHVIVGSGNCTSRSNDVFFYRSVVIVTERIESFFRTAEHLSTFSTVNYVFVRATLCTRRLYVVFLNRITCGVTCGGELLFIRISTFSTYICC